MAELQKSKNFNSVTNKRWRSGFFYRQAFPYEVTLDDTGNGGDKYRYIVSLPNEAPVEFLPLKGTIFGKHTSELAFEDGMPTGYKQTLDGEFIALAKIPADILEAYFTAVGSMFTLRSTAVTNEANYEKAIAGLAAQEAATKACLAAVALDDPAKIAEACTK